MNNERAHYEYCSGDKAVHLVTFHVVTKEVFSARLNGHGLGEVSLFKAKCPLSPGGT